jgi:hypothetical protein
MYRYVTKRVPLVALAVSGSGRHSASGCDDRLNAEG